MSATQATLATLATLAEDLHRYLPVWDNADMWAQPDETRDYPASAASDEHRTAG